MEVYESLSRAWLRRKYRRIEGGGVAVKRRRVRVAHLQQHQGDDGARRHRLRCFRLRVILVPGRLVASLKVACAKLAQQVVGTKAIEPPQPVLVLPKTMALRASCGDVVTEAWFQHALRRSIAEGRLAV